MIAALAGAILPAIVAGLNGLNRTGTAKWGVTNDDNRVAGFFVAILMLAAFGLFLFGPK